MSKLKTYLDTFYLNYYVENNNMVIHFNEDLTEENKEVLLKEYPLLKKFEKEYEFNLDFSITEKINDELLVDFLMNVLFNYYIDNQFGYYGLVLKQISTNKKELYPGDLIFVLHNNTKLKETLFIDCHYYNELKLEEGALKSIKPFDKEDVYLYIGVNKELNMSSGKIAAQTAHVIKSYMHSVIFQPKNPKNNRQYKTLVEDREYEQALYEYYRMNAQKTVCLSVKTKDLLKYENQGYITVRDNGLTEIPPNSLTAVCFGIVQKKDRPKFINRHNLFKE